MSYVTQYSLKTDPSEVMEDSRCMHCHGTGIKRFDALAEALGKEDYNGGISINRLLEDASDWRRHEDDMRELSLKFPGVLFTLNGAGEEAGDLWVKYFKNGKMQEERIPEELPDFDESKLV